MGRALCAAQRISSVMNCVSSPGWWIDSYTRSVSWQGITDRSLVTAQQHCHMCQEPGGRGLSLPLISRPGQVRVRRCPSCPCTRTSSPGCVVYMRELRGHQRPTAGYAETSQLRFILKSPGSGRSYKNAGWRMAVLWREETNVGVSGSMAGELPLIGIAQQYWPC